MRQIVEVPFPNAIAEVLFLEKKDPRIAMRVYQLDDGTFRDVVTLSSWEPNENWLKAMSRSLTFIGKGSIQ